MNERPRWMPACSMQTLRVRAAMLDAVRQFFRGRNYLEVETPCLSRDIVIDAWLEPMRVMQSGQRWYLQTSPEAHMKRLLAAGSGSIFQISRVFRSEENGIRHNPEFTMVEWYGVDSTWTQQIELTESLVRAALAASSQAAAMPADSSQYSRLSGPCLTEDEFGQTTYAEAFRRVFEVDVHQLSGSELMAVAKAHAVVLPESCEEHQRDDILNAMLAFAIEPKLGRSKSDGTLSPEFLCDYPPSQAALAVTSDSCPVVARRFELYIDGLELCNGYQELTDVDELVRREVAQNKIRTESELQALPGAAHLQAAMQSGLPQCSGVALGFDRLVMVATGARSIFDVLSFPSDRA